jgi:hypothetical protein
MHRGIGPVLARNESLHSRSNGGFDNHALVGKSFNGQHADHGILPLEYFCERLQREIALGDLDTAGESSLRGFPDHGREIEVGFDEFWKD